MEKKSIYEMTDEEQAEAAVEYIENLDIGEERKKSLLMLPPLAVLVGAAAIGVVGGAASLAGGKIMDKIWPDKKPEAQTMASKNEDMINACPDGSVFLDIGANYGEYTVMMAKKPRSMVYAFEPEPENIKKLREAVKDIPNVEVHGIALSDYGGLGKLMIHQNNPGGHSLEKKLIGKYMVSMEDTVDVAVLTLDEWCQHNGITKVDGIKIDVEAHEESVIRGGMETLKKYHPMIALETHQTIDGQKIKELLTECGYNVTEIEPDKAYFFKNSS